MKFLQYYAIILKELDIIEGRPIKEIILHSIKEDNILTNFFGTIVSDHEVGIFKYGLNNQDCVIHTGRYCIEAEQNVYETWWQMELYRF